MIIMAEWSSGDIIANGIRLHYHRTGGDKPPLVLCHGFSDNALCWTRVARDLEGAYDVIMVDARGHGQSEAPESGHDYATRAADLAAFIRALGLRRPGAWGHSMGAATVALAAADNPDLFSCVILEDPPWWDDQARVQRERAASREQRLARVLEQRAMTRETLIEQARQGNPKWHELELGPWAESKRQLSPHVVPAEHVPERPWREWVGRIACPILLLTAERGLVTPEVAAEATRLWQVGQVARIPETGHCIHRDNYAATMEAMRAFLAGGG